MLALTSTLFRRSTGLPVSRGGEETLKLQTQLSSISFNVDLSCSFAYSSPPPLALLRRCFSLGQLILGINITTTNLSECFALMIIIAAFVCHLIAE